MLRPADTHPRATAQQPAKAKVQPTVSVVRARALPTLIDKSVH
jgi:hypothetical protein